MALRPREIKKAALHYPKHLERLFKKSPRETKNNHQNSESSHEVVFVFVSKDLLGGSFKITSEDKNIL